MTDHEEEFDFGLKNGMSVYVGIGINLANDLPSPGVSRLTGVPVDREILMVKMFGHLEELIQRLKDGSWTTEYEKQWIHSGQRLTVTVDTSDSTGTVTGVNIDGFLELESSGKGNGHSTRTTTLFDLRCECFFTGRIRQETGWLGKGRCPTL